MKTQLAQKQTGFTIVELLIVVVVIAILAAITIVSYNGIQQRAHIVALQSDVRGGANQLELDNVTNSKYPNTKESANNGSGLQSSPGTSFYYTGPQSSNSYCLTGVSTYGSYYISSIDSSIKIGVCPGQASIIAGCPSGYIVVPGNSSFGTSDFCIMKYEAKNVSGVAVSQAAGAPWDTISQTTAISTATAACSGCHLTSEAEWMTVAANVLSVASNWSGGSVGSGYIYSGHSDNTPANSLAATTDDTDGYNGTTDFNGDSAITNGMVGTSQRRTLTLSNGEVIWDLAGNVWEWTAGTIASGQQPGLSGESTYNWKQWNNGSLLWKGLPASSRPSAISAAVAGYSSTQGIGQLYSNYGDTSGARSFMRGGTWSSSTTSGVLSLQLILDATTGAPGLGFRVAR